jgi:hypothetical protein
LKFWDKPDRRGSFVCVSFGIEIDRGEDAYPPSNQRQTMVCFASIDWYQAVSIETRNPAF